MNIYTIYKATCIVTGKSYIGFDSNWPNRQKTHLKESFIVNIPQYNYYFHRSIRKYGIESFKWEIIYQSKNRKHTLTVMEPYFIKYYDSFNDGYNMTLGGEGTFGATWCIGRKHSDITKLKMRNCKIGIPLSQTHINNMVESRAKHYKIIDPTGIEYKTNNLKLFCEEHGLVSSCMTNMLRGRRKHHKNWTAEYITTPY